MNKNPILMLIMVVIMAVIPLENKAKVWSAKNIPMAHLKNKNCYVSDPDGIMNAAGRHRADSILRKIDKECKIESAFIIVNNVEGGDPFRMAQDVGNKYGVGKKATNRGLVVVIAVKDKKYFIAPGEGLEKDLTDAECDKIARACIVANMRENKPGGAVVSTAKAIYSKLKTGDSGIEDGEEDEDYTAFYVAVGLFVLFVIIIARVDVSGGGSSSGSSSSGSSYSSRGSSSSSSSSSGGGSYGGGSFGGGGSGGSW